MNMLLNFFFAMVIYNVIKQSSHYTFGSIVGLISLGHQNRDLDRPPDCVYFLRIDF